MKALITKKVTLTVEPGSIVEVSEGQFKVLGDIAVAYKEEAKEEEPVEVEKEPEEVVEPPKKAKASNKTSKKK